MFISDTEGYWPFQYSRGSRGTATSNRVIISPTLVSLLPDDSEFFKNTRSFCSPTCKPKKPSMVHYAGPQNSHIYNFVITRQAHGTSPNLVQLIQPPSFWQLTFPGSRVALWYLSLKLRGETKRKNQTKNLYSWVGQISIDSLAHLILIST